MWYKTTCSPLKIIRERHAWRKQKNQGCHYLIGSKVRVPPWVWVKNHSNEEGPKEDEN
jgi:hypothetical protein